MGRPSRYAIVEGVRCKRCAGPSHDEPVWLPATKKYFYRDRHGYLSSRCRLCTNWAKLKTKERGSVHGIVPAAKVRPIVQEAVNRVGLHELSLRSGVSRGTLWAILSHRTSGVQKRVARAVLLELISARRKGENSANTIARVKNEKRIAKNGRCSGCGVALPGRTSGCRVCSWRANGQATRRFDDSTVPEDVEPGR